MRILHTSDLHLGKSLFEHSLLEEQEYMLNQIKQIAVEQNVNALIIAGDIYDRSIPSAAAVSLFDTFLADLILNNHISVFFISGNHDGNARLGFGSRLYATSGLYVATSLKKRIESITLLDNYGPVHFYLLPYCTPAEVAHLFQKKEEIKTYDNAYQYLLSYNQSYLNPQERNLIIAHSFFAPIQQNMELLTSESEISVGPADLVNSHYFSSYDYVAAGHLHIPQHHNNVYYSGSPLKYSLSEANFNKKVFLIDWKEKGNLFVTEIPLIPLHDVKILTGSIEYLTAQEKDDDYIFANITTNDKILNAAERLRCVYPNLLGLAFVDQKKDKQLLLKGISNIKNKSALELFCDFYQEMSEQPLSEEEKTIITSILNAIVEEERQ